jgi:plasmid stability protein
MAMNLILNLSANQEAALAVKAAAEGVSVEQYAREIIDRSLTIESNDSLFAAIRDLWKDMPEDVRALLPQDGASEHDHYIYGTPKKNQ